MELEDEEGHALCRGCKLPLRHALIVVDVERPGETGATYIVPSWHSDCIPDHLKSGQRGIRQRPTGSPVRAE